MKRKLTDEVLLEIKRQYESNIPREDTMRELNISKPLYYRALKKVSINVKEDYKDNYNKRLEEAEKMFNDGMKVSQIGNELHLKKGNISKYLKSKGYEILPDGRKHTFNYNFFEKIDTEEKAYRLGFLYADGCIGDKVKRGRDRKPGQIDLGLKRSDEGHIIKFLKSIGHSEPYPLRYRTIYLNDKEYHAVGVGLASVKMAADLCNLGCVPRKSLILTFPTKEQVPDKFLYDFIRGYVDGDGSVLIGKRVRKSGKVYITAKLGMCGTPAFLEGLFERTGWKRTKIHHDKRSNACGIGYHGTIWTMECLHTLYGNATIYLDRKYETYKELCAVLGSNS